MTAARTIAVYGAYGHTGRFVVDALCRYGYAPILCGRDGGKLAALGRTYPDADMRVASIDDAVSLDRALDGAAAVIHCAGPFLDTAAPVLEAALRAKIHYLDIAPEQRAVLQVFERYADAAMQARVTVLPAMAFYGGLADLLATAALAGATTADAIEIGVALDRWYPTAGTRATGRRNHYPRLVVSQGRLQTLSDSPPSREWNFPPPFGTQTTVALPLSEIVTISRHVRVRELHSYMNLQPLQDLRDPHTPPPAPVDASGRSSQRFAMEAVVRGGGRTERASVSGRDIYAVTAPLVIEALARILDGRCRGSGVMAAGAAFDAQDFLAALTPEHLQVTRTLTTTLSASGRC